MRPCLNIKNAKGWGVAQCEGAENSVYSPPPQPSSKKSTPKKREPERCWNPLRPARRGCLPPGCRQLLGWAWGDALCCLGPSSWPGGQADHALRGPRPGLFTSVTPGLSLHTRARARAEGINWVAAGTGADAEAAWPVSPWLPSCPPRLHESSSAVPAGHPQGYSGCG